MASLREQFIERLIREIFLRKGSGFVLKGGSAVRALLGEERLTKDVDLDFTNPKRSSESLHNTLRRAIAAAARGLPLNDLRVASPGKEEMTPRWKISFEDRRGRRLHVEVEVSRAGHRAPPGAVVQQRFAPVAAGRVGPFWVDVYDAPTLAATKLAALLGREAARDVYDLDVLLPAGTPSAEQVRWAIERAGLSDEDPREVLAAHIDGLTWERFVNELRDSLPDHVAERIDEAEWAAMKRRVGDAAERLLSMAAGSGS